jgi:hypothetical protein
LLETNGKKSSGKRTRALNICFFFITNQVEKGNTQIEHGGTNDMIGVFLRSLCKAKSSKDFGTILLVIKGHGKKETKETQDRG